MLDKKNNEDKTVERIIDAAFDVVQDYTISGTRMALIAQRAGIFQSNIHYYFRSKRDLMLAVQKRVLIRCISLREHLLAQCGDSVDERVRVFWGQKLHFLRHEQKYDFAEIDYWVQSRVDDELKQEIVASFANWRHEICLMLIDFHVPAEKAKLLASVMVSMMEGASFQYLIDENAFDLDQYFDFCTQMVLLQIQNN